MILLRNMPGGLVNGTRLIVVKLMQHIIDAEIATGLDKGRRVFIPRLSITPSNTKRMFFYFPSTAVPVVARICHDYQQGPGANTVDSGGVLAQACFFATGSFMWLSFDAAHGGAFGLVQGGSTTALNGAPAGVYTSNVVYRKVL